MVPIPQYPLYSATITEYGMDQVSYPDSRGQVLIGVIFCLRDRTSVRSGGETGLLSPFDLGFPGGACAL